MMIEAPIPGLIGRLAVPTIISMLVTSFYNMADTFFVSQIGTSATAAVGVVFPFMSVIQAIGFFFGHGSGNAVSRKLGAQDTDSAEQIAACGFFSALGSGLLILILGLLFVEPFARLLGSTDTILPYTLDYLSIILIGAPYMTAALVINNQMRFQGNAFYSMIGITSGAVLNVVLDPLLIFVFKMGIAGAAWATIISQLFSFVLLLYGAKKSGCIPLRIKNMKYFGKQIGEIAGGGLPSLCRQGLASLATIALNVSAGGFGDAAIAAMSVVNRVTFFANASIIGFGQGFQPVCGYNYGAGNVKRVKEAYWFCVKLSVIVLIGFGITGFAFADPLMKVFRADDLEVVRIGTLALRMQCVTLPLMGFIIMNTMLFQTCKWTMPASILSSARQGLFFIPIVILLPMVFGILGVQLAQPLSDVAAFTMAVIFSRKLMKKL